jgi:hypothetical protein
MSTETRMLTRRWLVGADAPYRGGRNLRLAISPDGSKWNDPLAASAT